MKFEMEFPKKEKAILECEGEGYPEPPATSFYYAEDIDEWREAMRKRLEEIIERAERYTNMGARLETRYVAQEVLEWLKEE